MAGAQTAVDGAVAGRVLDASGTPVAGAKVTLIAVDAAEPGQRVGYLARSVQAGKGGEFVALRLAPGEYVAEAVDADGTVARASVSVELGDVAEVELRILSPVASPASQALQGQAAREPGTSANLLAALPVEGGRWEEVAKLSSELNEAGEEQVDSSVGDAEQQAGERGRPAGGGALFSFRGVAPTQNATLLDGVSGDQGFRGGARGGAEGGPRTGSTFGQGSVRAFRPAAHGFSAQYGGGAGRLAVTASRSGSDRLRGGGFYVAHESAWAASNPFSAQTHYRDGVITSGLAKPQDTLQLLGGRLGGGIWPRQMGRRIFGFAAVEQQWRRFPAVSSPITPVGAASFYALSATQSALLGTRGVSAAATRAALNYLDSLSGEVDRRANRGLQFGRLDVRVSERDSISASFARARLSSPAGAAAGPSTAVIARGRASVGDSTVNTNAVTARWLRTFSASLTNELRAQFALDLEFEAPRAPLAQEPAIGPGGYAPQVSIAGQFLYGTPAALGRNAYPDEQRVQLADVVQWSVGRHLLTAGFDWSRVHDRIDALNNLDGTFQYDSGATGGRAGGLVDWITDFTFNTQAYPNGACPSINSAVHFFCFRSFTQSFGQQQVEFAMHDFAGFAQDLWRVRPGLTVELGARYEYTLLPLPQTPNTALDVVFRATGATSVFPEDRNNVGPRMAVAWSPAWRKRPGHWGTLRLGYGIYYGRLQGSRVRAALQNTALPSTARTIHITPTTVTACPQVANQGFGYPCVYVSTPPAAVLATTSANLFARNFRLPAVQQAELTIEREVGRNVSLRATYSMAVATQLPNTVDVNVSPSAGLGRFVLQGGDGRVGVRDGETFVVPVYTGRVTTQYGPVTALESNANATWHGLTVEARARRGELQVHGSYTWSKAIDYGAEQGSTPRRNGQFDPFSVGYDKGLADANFPQRFAGDAVWRSKLTRGPEMLRKVASGWRMSALGTAGSGRGYSYEIFGGDRLSGGSYSINGSGGSAWLPTVGRNTLGLPMRWNVDTRLGRGFRVSERVHGEGYVEAFNVANHTNAARVDARAFLVGTAVAGVTPLVFQSRAVVAAEGLTTPAFGTVTSSTTGLSHERQVQVGVRIEF